jgi:hypothetical protein
VTAAAPNLRRRLWLVALVSAVAGGLLLMHGVQPPAASAEHDDTAVAETAVGHHPGSHTDHDSHHRHEHRSGKCDGCHPVAHGALLCVAVVGSLVGRRLLHRFGVALRRLVGAVAATVAATGATWWNTRQRSLRPPRPVWVQLCVMRC